MAMTTQLTAMHARIVLSNAAFCVMAQQTVLTGSRGGGGGGGGGGRGGVKREA